MSIQSETQASGTPASTEEPTSAQAPGTEAAADQGTTAPTPPDTGTSEQDSPVLESFKLEDVPEAYRGDVERYVKQVQGDYSRKTAALAEQRRAAQTEAEQHQAAIELYERLQSDDTREQALVELLQAQGFELDEAQDAAAEQIAAEGQGLDAEAERRIAQLEADAQARAAADEEAERAAAEELVLGHVNDALDQYAYANDLESVPDGVRRQIITLAAGRPRLDDGMPDMQGAIDEYEGLIAAEVTRRLKSKDVPRPDLSGQTGTRTFDPRDTKQRLAHANRVAEAALARAR